MVLLDQPIVRRVLASIVKKNSKTDCSSWESCLFQKACLRPQQIWGHIFLLPAVYSEFIDCCKIVDLMPRNKNNNVGLKNDWSRSDFFPDFMQNRADVRIFHFPTFWHPIKVAKHGDGKDSKGNPCLKTERQGILTYVVGQHSLLRWWIPSYFNYWINLFELTCITSCSTFCSYS